MLFEGDTEGLAAAKAHAPPLELDGDWVPPRGYLHQCHIHAGQQPQLQQSLPHASASEHGAHAAMLSDTKTPKGTR